MWYQNCRQRPTSSSSAVGSSLSEIGIDKMAASPEARRLRVEKRGDVVGGVERRKSRWKKEAKSGEGRRGLLFLVDSKRHLYCSSWRKL